jgi:hypothetical protein
MCSVLLLCHDLAPDLARAQTNDTNRVLSPAASLLKAAAVDTQCVLAASQQHNIVPCLPISSSSSPPLLI